MPVLFLRKNIFVEPRLSFLNNFFIDHACPFSTKIIFVKFILFPIFFKDHSCSFSTKKLYFLNSFCLFIFKKITLVLFLQKYCIFLKKNKKNLTPLLSFFSKRYIFFKLILFPKIILKNPGLTFFYKKYLFKIHDCPVCTKKYFLKSTPILFLQRHFF